MMPGGWVDRKNIRAAPMGADYADGARSRCLPDASPSALTIVCTNGSSVLSQDICATRYLKRDRGVCVHCGLDTIREHRKLKRARGDQLAWRLCGTGDSNTRMRKSLWDADHILPVTEGGGECDLDNIRTLCLRCHRVVTAQLRERIRRAKVAAMLAAESLSRNLT